MSKSTTHTTFAETPEGLWTYTRQEKTSTTFNTLEEAEEHEKATYGSLGTANYDSLTSNGRKQIEDHLDPFAS